LKIINVNDDRYVICGTVLAQKVTNKSTEELKNQYHLADTVLRNGDKFYLCMKIINTEFIDIEQNDSTV
jgi:predicted peroxiredoxin